MTSLGDAGLPPMVEVEDRRDWKPLLVITVFIVFILLLSATSGAVYVISHTTTTSSSTSTSTSTTTSTTTSSTTSTTSSTSTSTTTSSTSTTTTTLPCGGLFQDPCANNTCESGYTLGSTGLCQSLSCAQTVRSGRSGCGDWALNWCTPDAINP